MHLPGGIRMRYRPFRERGFRTAHITGAARGAWHIYPADAGAAGDADAAGIQHSQFGRPGRSGSAAGIAVGTGQSVRVLAGPV